MGMYIILIPWQVPSMGERTVTVRPESEVIGDTVEDGTGIALQLSLIIDSYMMHPPMHGLDTNRAVDEIERMN